jgi:hypothetical protein
MITVYGEGRGFRVVWLLEEMGLPYRLRDVGPYPSAFSNTSPAFSAALAPRMALAALPGPRIARPRRWRSSTLTGVHRLGQFGRRVEAVEHQGLAGGLFGARQGLLAGHEHVGLQLGLGAGQLGVLDPGGQQDLLGADLGGLGRVAGRAAGIDPSAPASA